MMLSCFVAILLLSCSRTITNTEYELASAVENKISNEARYNSMVTGKSYNTMILFFSANMSDFSEESAIRNVIKNANKSGIPANALANAEVKYKVVTIPDIFAHMCFIAEGNAVNVEIVE